MEPAGRVGFGLEITKKQIWNDEKRASVREEMKRMSTLPANSSYAAHRLRVLNKILNLISLQRTASQDEELELLFAGLHI
ncbi:uncharacterized protein [Primulina eburnea]|uniref:uncharacterized protein n=1 Tax=Primulina eburnea TaxID=1245227 RepID=UPI003C6BF397